METGFTIMEWENKALPYPGIQKSLIGFLLVDKHHDKGRFPTLFIKMKEFNSEMMVALLSATSEDSTRASFGAGGQVV